MSVRDTIQTGLMRSVDVAYALRPRNRPSIELLQRCKLIAHRGEHNGRSIYENTIAAFDQAVDAGVWGVEFDIRWTRDLHPVVIHDPDLLRVFGLNLRVADVTLEELRRQGPLVPTLAEVIDRFGHRLHLMVELKHDDHPQPTRQNKLLAQLLEPLAAGEDYHLLSLMPGMFDLVTFAPRTTCFPIAQTQVSAFSRLAGDNGFGGLFGHYTLINDALLKQHHQNDQKIGTGYIGSRNCLFREVQRGVDYLFSNCAARMQKIVDQLVSATDAVKP